MVNARIRQLGLTGAETVHKYARVSRLVLTGTAVAGVSKRARVSQLVLTGNYAARRARISRLTLTGSSVQPLLPSLTVSATKVEPGTTVTISAAGTSGSGVVLDWLLASGGDGLTLVGAGPVRTLVAPQDYQGRTVMVQVDYLDAFGQSATRTVTVTVYPQQLWFCRYDGQLVAVAHSFLRI